MVATSEGTSPSRRGVCEANSHKRKAGEPRRDLEASAYRTAGLSYGPRQAPFSDTIELLLALVLGWGWGCRCHGGTGAAPADIAATVVAPEMAPCPA